MHSGPNHNGPVFGEVWEGFFRGRYRVGGSSLPESRTAEVREKGCWGGGPRVTLWLPFLG